MTCAVQGCENSAGVFDHHHQSGEARGPLCSECNKALGRIDALYEYRYGTPPLMLIDELLSHTDGDFELRIGSATYWSGHLRLTVTDPDDAPSESVCFYRTGGERPDEIASSLFDAYVTYADNGGLTLPVPDWKLGACSPECQEG